MLRIDVHQHLWSEPLVEALAARSKPPYVQRRGRVWELKTPSEAVCTIDVAGDNTDNRVALVHLDGLDLALLSLSTLLGVEALPGEEAETIIDAYHASLEDLPRSFGGWASLPLREARPVDVDRAVDRGFAGITIPAGAIATPNALGRLLPLLEWIEVRDVPVFVHPGADPFAPAPASVDGPPWFPALTSYVSSMHDAWHAFIAIGRRHLPNLKIVFAMLGGCAPLHVERLAARGGPAARVVDRGIYFDTSSYGARAIEAMVDVVGIDQLLYGSDRPVVAPPSPPGPLGAAAWEAMTCKNPARLFATRMREPLEALA